MSALQNLRGKIADLRDWAGFVSRPSQPGLRKVQDLQKHTPGGHEHDQAAHGQREGSGERPADEAGEMRASIRTDLGTEAAASLKMDGGEFGDQYADRVGSFVMDGNDYNIMKSEEAAEELALELVRDDLEHEPELFNRDWLQGHIDTDHLRDELRSDVEEGNRSYYEDIASESSDEYQSRQVEELVQGGYLDEADVKGEDGDLVDLDANQETTGRVQEAVERAIEAKTKSDLEDPVAYLENFYSKEDAIKRAMDIGGINIEDAAKEAVALDGWAHFLSRYDGDYGTTKDGRVYFRKA